MLSPIVPAPVKKNNEKNSVLGMNSVNIAMQQDQNSGYNKKKFTYTNIPYGQQQQPVSVVRRNARERNRVKQVNNGFVTLRQHIPQNIIQALSNGGRGPHKKLSKVDTLRLAVEYIRRLQDLVTDLDITKTTTSLSDFSNSDFDQMLASPNSETSSYYTTSPEPIMLSQSQQQQQQQIYSNTMQHNNMTLNHSTSSLNSHSEASISPAPSYISETSSLSPSSMPNYGYSLNSITNSNLITTPTTTGATITPSGLNYQFKYEPYDDYSTIHQNNHHHHHNQHNSNNNTIIVETSTTSEDEELLDYISMWQEEQQ